MRQYYLNNQEKFVSYRSRADMVAVRRRVKDWRKRNPERRLELNARRRFVKAQNGVFRILDKELRRLYSSPCVGCGAMQDITADHIVPLVRGGRHSIGNLQPLCRTCNSSKHDKLMIEWRVSA
jgi:5-methylcytosine-specific restriction endonuclease McrA